MRLPKQRADFFQQRFEPGRKRLAVAMMPMNELVEIISDAAKLNIVEAFQFRWRATRVYYTDPGTPCFQKNATPVIDQPQPNRIRARLQRR